MSETHTRVYHPSAPDARDVPNDALADWLEQGWTETEPEDSTFDDSQMRGPDEHFVAATVTGPSPDLVAGPDPAKGGPDGGLDGADALEAMTVAALKDGHPDVDFAGLTRKADIVAAIRAHLAGPVVVTPPA